MAHDLFSVKAEKYAHMIYAISKKLPKDEAFGITSQLRRASLSVPLNIVEGYARQSTRTQVQFLNVAFGSLKESQFLIGFIVKEGLLDQSDAQPSIELGDELARMIWSKTKTLKQKIKI